MTLLTPDTQAERSEKLLESIQTQLEYLRQKLERHTEGAETGGKFDETGTKRALTEVSGLVSSCLKLEATLAECRRKQSEIARGGYAFDLRVARSEVGCALNRLRACCDTGAVSE